MKRDRRSVYCCINAFVFLASVAVMLFLSWNIGDNIGNGVFYVYPKRQYGNSITGLDRKAFKRDITYTDMIMSYETIGNIRIDTQHTSAQAGVIYTNADYVYINRCLFVDGWFFIEKDEMRNVIVLSETLAWRLFGHTDAAGETVFVKSEEYEVAGVIRQDNLGEADSMAWLPVKNLQAEVEAEGLYFMSHSYDRISNAANIALLLDGIGKPSGNFQITDMNEYMRNIARRPVLALSAFGLFVAVACITRLAGLLIAARKGTGRRADCAHAFLYLAVAAAAVYFMDFGVRPSGVYDGWAEGLIRSVTNMRLLPAPDYLSFNMLKLHNINVCSNIAFAVCAFALINMVFLASYTGGRGALGK